MTRPINVPRIDDEISFRRLETLLAFIETGSLARTAERLGTSSVSVHRALHGLEEGTRCALFRHEGRNLIPTEAAHVLADVALEVLQSLDKGINATRQIAGYCADHIRIGSLFSLTSRAVPTIILGLKAKRPDLRTELLLGSNSDLLQKLRDGTIDVALMGMPDRASDLEFEPLFDDEIFFAAPATSRYAAQTSVDLATCKDESFVSLNDGFVTQSGFDVAFRIAAFSPKVVMKTGDIFSLMNLVAGGVGCTLLPGRVRGVLPAEVRLIPLQSPVLVRQIITVSFLKSRERDPNILALLTVCRTSKQRLL